jgi:hypothetical protein
MKQLKILLPELARHFMHSEKAYKQYIEYYLEKNHVGWKPVSLNTKHNYVICEYEKGGE